MFPKCEDSKRYGSGLGGSNDSRSQIYPIVAAYYIEESRNELHGEATGREIGNLVLDALKSHGIPIENCIAFSADNANKGAACLPAKFEEVLVDIFYYLEKSAKRKDRLVEFQGMHNTEIAGAVAALGQLLLGGDKVEKPAAPKLSGSYQIPKTAAALADMRDEVQRDHQKQKEPRGKMDATPAKKVKPSSESTGRASLTPQASPRYFHASASTENYTLILGGCNGSREAILEPFAYDFSFNHWIPLDGPSDLGVFALLAVHTVLFKMLEESSHTATLAPGQFHQG
ncbi:hypothetical protein HPB52_017270 [Rhipicephalus sanguineus]|uniref:Uncharacterized protein n=1 Tax=Rhipicephalus sanguineus TaxID=34632 RepID=A0A9D4Q270_RHISA|nr:hypothetical protein HPB52_017270 [Rhipicephalus sanguineus]